MEPLSLSYLQDIQQLQKTDRLESILTDDIVRSLRENELLPGIWAGYDPAEINDRAGFVILSKDSPTLNDTNPKLKCRCLKDLSIGFSGHKTRTYLDQVKYIIELDKKYKFEKILVDETSHKTVVELLKEYFGSRVEGLTFTKPKKASMAQTLRLILQERLLEFNSQHKNFELLRKEAYELEASTLKHPKGGSDDIFWSLALAIQATGFGQNLRKVESGYVYDEPFYF